MGHLSSAIAAWNIFAPSLPITVDPATLWIALPLAAIAMLFLVVFSSGRRALPLLVSAVGPSSAPRLAAAPVRRARPRPQLRSQRPRGPTAPGVAAPI